MALKTIRTVYLQFKQKLSAKENIRPLKGRCSCIVKNKTTFLPVSGYECRLLSETIKQFIH